MLFFNSNSFFKKYVSLIFGFTTACSTLSNSHNANEKITKPLTSSNQLRCLAEAIHGEARGEPEEGKLFVGRVVATRVQYGYGKNYCEVVYAKNQFAPKKDFNSVSMSAAKKSHKLGPNGITHFHSYNNRRTSKASFSTSPKCTYTGKIGGHWGFACIEQRSLSSIKNNP